MVFHKLTSTSQLCLLPSRTLGSVAWCVHGRPWLLSLPPIHVWEPHGKSGYLMWSLKPQLRSSVLPEVSLLIPPQGCALPAGSQDTPCIPFLSPQPSTGSPRRGTLSSVSSCIPHYFSPSVVPCPTAGLRGQISPGKRERRNTVKVRSPSDRVARGFTPF